MVNVKDFGAVGNGSTNDTVAIKNALDASLSVYFPPGEYLVKEPAGTRTVFALRDGHHLFGDGYSSKISIDPTSLEQDLNILSFTGSGTGLDGNLLIENLHIEGINKAFYDTTTGWTYGNGVFLVQCTNIIIRNCFFANFGEAGVGKNIGCAIDVEGGVQNILIAGNHITGGKGTGDASDIYLHFTSHPLGETGPGFAIIVNNFCSCADPPSDSSANNSQGIFVNAGNSTRGTIIIA